MHRGYVKLWRKIEDWSWFKSSKTLQLFIFLLIKANHQPYTFMGYEIDRGQVVTGRDSISRQLGMTAQSFREATKRLKTTNDITIKTTNKFSIISIVNFTLYQDKTTNSTTNKTTNQQPTNNQQTTTIKECKNVKNEKNINIKPSDKINPLFWEFKKLYPNCLAFKRTQEAFHKLAVTPELWETMKTSILAQKESKQWRDGFVPASFKWLEEERWKDSITPTPNDKRSQLLERLRKK